MHKHRQYMLSLADSWAENVTTIDYLMTFTNAIATTEACRNHGVRLKTIMGWITLILPTSGKPVYYMMRVHVDTKYVQNVINVYTLAFCKHL
jgi:hypothetical protein